MFFFESCSGLNFNCVCMFGFDKLVWVVVEKCWDWVKIVCSQFYSKDFFFGLSFVWFYSFLDKDEVEVLFQKVIVIKFGQFCVKEEDESVNFLRLGVFFFSWINKIFLVIVSDLVGFSYVVVIFQVFSVVFLVFLVFRVIGSIFKFQEFFKGKRKLDLN